MPLTRLLGLLLIVAGFAASAQTFEGLDLTPKKPRKTAVGVKLSTPVPGAQVFIDGEPAGEAPVAEKVVKPGDHVIRVERPGFSTIEDKVNLLAGKKQDLTYTLVPTGAVVTIEAAEAGATCSIDNGPAEVLPLTKVLPEGKHLLAVGGLGYKVEKRTIDAKAGVDQKESFTLVVDDRPVAANLEPPDKDSDLEVELGRKKKDEASTPLFSRWYVWAGIGAVVVGGIVTAVAVSQAPRPTPDPSIVCAGPCDATLGWQTAR